MFDPEFLQILGANPSITEIASNASFAFAHEAPIYYPDTDEFFFASNAGGALGNSGMNQNNVVNKISMAAVETALASGQSPARVQIQQVRPSPSHGGVLPPARVRRLSYGHGADNLCDYSSASLRIYR